MNPMLNLRHCQAFADRVSNLGGKVPDDLQGLLDAAHAVKEWAPGFDPDSIANAINSRKFTAKTAASFLDAELNRPARDPHEVKANATNWLVRAFAVSLARGGADQSIESLRPIFEKARDGFDTASEWITPSTTAEQVLAAGAEATEAWRALAEHRRTLDALYDVVASLRWDFQIVPVQPFMDSGNEAIISFFVDETVDLRSMPAVMDPVRTSSLRGGRWTGLRAVTQLRLNTLTEALAIIDDQQRAYQESNHRRWNLPDPA